MHFTTEDESGASISFECADTIASRMTCTAILEGRTYPHIPFVRDVRTILDVGANCGATTVHLARRHTAATVHAFEPGSEALGYLERNTASLPNVRRHPIGLHASDQDAVLCVPADDIGRASISVGDGPRPERAEPVRLRSAAGWVAENHVDRIDILKLDVEGCELSVLESLRPLLPTVQVLYVEYDSRSARRSIDRLLEPTHELFLAMLMALDQGECLYLRRDLADHPDAIDRLRAIFGRVV